MALLENIAQNDASGRDCVRDNVAMLTAAVQAAPPLLPGPGAGLVPASPCKSFAKADADAESLRISLSIGVKFRGTTTSSFSGNRGEVDCATARLDRNVLTTGERKRRLLKLLPLPPSEVPLARPGMMP